MPIANDTMNKVLIIYDDATEVILNASDIHPVVLDEIREHGYAEYMFENGTFATLVAYK